MKIYLFWCCLLCFISPCNCQLWKQYADSASFYSNGEKIDSAVHYYQKAKEILDRDSIGSVSQFMIYRNLADTYYSKGKFNEGEVIYIRNEQLIENLYGKEDTNYASNALMLGAIYAIERKYPKAEPYFIEAVAIRKKWYSNNHPRYAEACISLANLTFEEGNYDKAEVLYLEAKRIFEQTGTTVSNGYAQCTNGLARLYTELGEYGKAEPLALVSKSTRAKVFSTSHPSYTLSCIILANLYVRMGQYEKAEKLYLESKEIREKVYSKEHFLYAAVCDILAELYMQMGEFGKAEPLYLESKNIRSHQPDKYNVDYGESCNNLGILYLNLGDVNSAKALALEAREVWTKTLPADHPNLTFNNSLLGNIYADMNKYDSSQKYLMIARKSIKTELGIYHPDYAENSIALAEVYWNKQSYTKADSFYTQALKSQFDQIQKVFRFTNEREKNAYINSVNSSTDEYKSFCYQHPSVSSAGACYDILLANRNLILSSSLQVRQMVNNSENDSLIKKYDQWIGLKQLLAYAYTNPKYAAADDMKDLEDQAGIIEKELARSSIRENINYTNKSSWRKIQTNLKPEEAAIEFFEFKYYDSKNFTDSVFYAALLLRKDKPFPILIRLFNRNSLDSIFRNTGNTSNENVAALYARGVGFANANPISASVYKLIWQPLENNLKGIHKIYFASAGLLYRIAFAALPIDEQMLLSDKYNLVQLSTTAMVSDMKTELVKARDKIILYGGIEYDVDAGKLKELAKIYKKGDPIVSRSLPSDLKRGSSWNYLPGTAVEIDMIGKLPDANKFVIKRIKGIEATEESVKALNGKNSPSILHIASHGFFFPDPVKDKTNESLANDKNGRAFRSSDDPMFRSGILLAGANNSWTGNTIQGVEDGILTAYEVSNLYLPNTKLVVLSACETALGDIQGSEGVYGLQRAFRIAGVQNLVMSLWKVPDAETGEFMEEFYRKIFQGETVQNAFYFTQKQLKDKYRKTPYKWAAWILIR